LYHEKSLLPFTPAAVQLDELLDTGLPGCVVMSMNRHFGESRNPGALILKAILDPGFHRGDEKGEK
jgi:hypothetical protein